jgi:Flp pilus assembly protein TadD
MWMFWIACFLTLGTGCRRDAVTLGLREMEQDHTQQAETLFQKAAARDPTDPSPQANLGLIHMKLGRTNQALSAFRKAAELAPDDPRPLEFLAAISADAGQWRTAADLLATAARRDPRSPRVLTALAIAELETSGPQPAKMRLEQVLGIAPNYSPALYNLALLNRDWLANPAESKELFQRYVRISQDTRHVALARAALAALQSIPSPRKAASPGASSLQPPETKPAPAPPTVTVPRRPQAAAEDYNRGVRNHMSGDLDQALQDYSRALQNDPTLANAHYNLGLVFKSKGDLVKSRAALQQALVLAPNMTDARYMLALVLRDLHDDKAADAELNEIIRKTPHYAPAHHALGLLYKNDPTKFELARVEFARYLELAPDGPSAREARNWLKYNPQPNRRGSGP